MSYVGKILDFEHFVEEDKNGYILITEDNEIVISCENDVLNICEDVDMEELKSRSLLGIFIQDFWDNVEELNMEVRKFIGTLKSICLSSNKGNVHFKVKDKSTMINIVFRERFV